MLGLVSIFYSLEIKQYNFKKTKGRRRRRKGFEV